MRPLTVVEAIRRAIVEAMIHADGNTHQAAKLLMIGRTTLYRKMLIFEVKPEEYGRSPRKRSAASPHNYLVNEPLSWNEVSSGE